MILSVNDLSMAFGEETLFEHLSFRVESRDKIGIIGANGCGKTTLFRLILGTATPESGGIVRESGLEIGYVQQYACRDSNRSAYEETLSVFHDVMQIEGELQTLAKRLETSCDASLIAAHETLHEKFLAMDGLTYRSRTASALAGLGFSAEEQALPVSALSGGQRSKIELARLLLSAPALLLLDEPTNHLDIDAVAWLEDYLASYKGAAMIISHDRYFLDRVTTRTFSIENKKLYCVNGNYSKYRAVRDEIMESERHAYENTMREVHRIEGIIEQQRRWNREKNIKTAESKEKQIERLTKDLETPPPPAPPIHPTFPIRFPSGNDCLFVKNAAVSFDGRPLFTGVDLDIKRGERVFLVGPNGCGKTTLMNYLLTNPAVRFGTGVTKGYFDQHGTGVDGKKTPLTDLADAFPLMGDTALRSALAAYHFTGEDVFKRIETMSGGERARVLLCKLGLKQANFLFLDEPTNHLDLPTREQLEEALRTFEGTLFIISHDRYLINALATRVLELTPTGIRSFAGNYDAYLEARTPHETVKPTVKADSEQKNAYLERKKQQSRLRTLKTAVTKAETAVADAEAEIARLETALAEPETATDYQKLAELTAALETAQKTLETAMEEWATLTEEWEHAGEEMS